MSIFCLNVLYLNYKKGGYLGIMAPTLGASLLGNILAGKGVIPADEARIEQNRISKIVSSFK